MVRTDILEKPFSSHGGHQGVASAALLDVVASFFWCTFDETFDARVTSDGATVEMSLARVGGGDLTMNFRRGRAPFAATTKQLTAGTDSAPVENYVYILESDRLLTVSTVDWPTTAHIRVGFFYVPSATWVFDNGGVYGNNNINDHQSDQATGIGHLLHMADWMRHRGARWNSGCALTVTESDPDVFIQIAAGSIAQVHHHTFDALDSQTGDKILVINEPGDAWAEITTLNSLTQDSGATAFGNNKWYKVVVGGIANKSGELSPMFLLLPSGTYNTQAEAAADVDKKATFVMPAALTLEAPLGFLVASVVLQHQATKTVHGETKDIRDPNSLLAGGGGGAGDVLGPASSTDNAVPRFDGTTGNLLQNSTASIADTGVMSVPALGTGGPTEYDLIVGNPASYGMAKFGNFRFGRTSLNAGGMDMDGAVVLSNIGGPITGDIEFALAESSGGDARLLIPKSGVGLATFHSRSFAIYGPATATTDLVKLSHCQGLGLFHNLVFDTVGSGAELGVQGACEIEGNLYIDNILESTTAAGVTISGRDVATLVAGPASVADQDMCFFDGTDGKTIKRITGVGYFTGPPAGITIRGTEHFLGLAETGDITLKFDTTTNDGVLVWDVADDRFEFDDDVLLRNAEQLSFRTDTIFINSPLVGDLHIESLNRVNVNVSSPAEGFTIEMGGVEKARFHPTDGALCIGLTAPETDTLIHTAMQDEHNNLIVQVARGATAKNNKIILRASRGTIASPTAIVANDNTGFLSFDQFNGSAWVTRCRIFAHATAADAAELRFGAGSGGVGTDMTLTAAGNLDFAGTKGVTFGGGTGQMINEPSAGRMKFDSATDHVWEVGVATEMTLSTGRLTFEAPSSFSWDWVWTGSELTLSDVGGTERMSITAGGVGFNGQAGSVRPNYTITNPTTNRSIDVATISHANLAQVVGTIIQDLINIGSYQ